MAKLENTALALPDSRTYRPQIVLDTGKKLDTYMSFKGEEVAQKHSPEGVGRFSMPVPATRVKMQKSAFWRVL
jgi:hypothetical protein